MLVTDLDYELRTIAQLYRDRGDAENAFDELKNQWGWGGFTTHDLKRCRFTAMTVALAYNWWSLFVRLAHPKARLEAITSRPLLLSGIGRLSSHAGQTHLSITPMHAQAAHARALLTAVSEQLTQWKHTAEQLPLVTVWQRVCEFITTHVTGFNWLATANSAEIDALQIGSTAVFRIMHLPRRGDAAEIQDAHIMGHAADACGVGAGLPPFRPMPLLRSRRVRVVLHCARAVDEDDRAPGAVQFVVDNRTGGNGLIPGNGIAAKAPPDGYTILLAHTGEFAVNQWVFKNIPFDIDNDFVPVTMVNDGPMLVVVNSQSPIGSFKDLIAAAKAKPGALAFGSPGSGAVNHLATEWMAAAAGVKLLHVPYKGGAPAVSAVATNEVALTTAGLPGVLPNLEAKRVKVLGVTTARRWDFGRDWMPAAEAGMPGVDASIWTGLFVP